MPLCYLGLGSNLKSPKRQLQIAIAALQKCPKSIITDISSIYFNSPIGVRAQPMFYNIVVAMQTSLPPHQLFQYCKKMERNQGRIHKQRWGARTIDIDILLYGDSSINNQTLRIPHPHMLQRDFVLIPLLELSPNVRLPTGERIASAMTSAS